MADRKIDRSFYIIFGLLLVLHLLLFNYPRLLPFVDIPNHLAQATIYRYSGQPDNQLDQYYPFRLFPYVGTFHIIFMGSPVFPSVEFAGKVFHSLYIVLLSVSIFLLIRKLGGDVWFSLFSFLFIYNRNFFWGMSAFTFSIPVFFLLCLVVWQHLTKEHVVWYMRAAVIFLFMYFLHMITTLFALFIFFITVILAFWESPVRLLRKSSVAVPVLILVLLAGADKGDPGIGKYLVEFYTSSRSIYFAWRVKELLTFDHYFLLSGMPGENIAFFFSMFVMIAVFYRQGSCSGNASQKSAGSSRQFAYALLYGSLASFFLLPAYIPGHGAEYQRFSVFFFLSLVIWGSLSLRRSTARFKVGLVAICLVYLLLWAQCLIRFEKQNHGFDQDFFPSGNRGETLGALIYDQNYNNYHAYNHFPNYFIIWRHGIAATALTRYRYYIFDGIPPLKSPPYHDESVFSRETLAETHLNADYLLVRGAIPEAHENQINQEFSLEKISQRWSLYKRRVSDLP